MTGAVWRSFFVAALFGLHPLRVQSVAWVAERKDVLSTLFFMLTLWAYCKNAETRIRHPASGITHHATLFYLLALLFFALGLMSKGMLVTLPFLLLLLDYWPLQRLRSPVTSYQSLLPLLREKAPFFLLAAVSSAVTFFVQKGAGAVVEVARLSWAARVGNALVAYCRYVGKLFYPVNLAVFYPHPAHWPGSAVLVSGLLLLGLTALALGWRRRYPWLLVGWFWFVGALVPVIGLVQVGAQSMADRYTYIPSIGIIVLSVWGAYELALSAKAPYPGIIVLSVWGAHGLTRQRRYRVVGLSVVAAVVTLLCVAITRRETGYWQNGDTLFRRALAVTENNYLAYLHQGDSLADQGASDEAIEMYRWAVQIVPGYTDAHNNLGAALLAKGSLDEAIAQFQEALALSPNYAEAHNGLGAALKSKGELDEAIRRFERAIALKPDLPEAHSNLGNALAIKGRFAEAIGQFEEALKLKPASAETHCDLAAALSETGRRDEAITHLKQAIKLKPGFPDAEQLLRTLGASPAP